MSFGGWTVDVNVGGAPQKVASFMTELADTKLGAQYKDIAYIGSQLANGENHALLAEQTVVTGRDTKNVVLCVINERPEGLSLVGIDRLVESGAPMGGTVVDVKTEIPAEAMDVWNKAFEGFTGSKVVPFALLGTQLVNGTNWIFAVEMATVTPDPVKKVAIVTINDKEKTVHFADMLRNRQNASLGYSFTW